LREKVAEGRMRGRPTATPIVVSQIAVPNQYNARTIGGIRGTRWRASHKHDDSESRVGKAKNAATGVRNRQ
jgi:hypothetical protein